jgi:hypothetical protein
MIIIAWNGGTPSDIFDRGVFKQVLSIFITAAILKLGQGMPPSPPLSMFLFYIIAKANGYMLLVLLPMRILVACLVR